MITDPVMTFYMLYNVILHYNIVNQILYYCAAC